MSRVQHTFTEIVLPYQAEQYEAWKRGDKSLIPAFHECHDIVVRQPSHHFGEFFVLDHFHRHGDWLGYRFFALTVTADLDHPRYAPGGLQIQKMFPAAKLAAFRRARSFDPREYVHGKGEPDLFLFKSSGEMLFLEVKKGTDSPDDEQYQLRCLAQIRSILGCGAEMVYLRNEMQAYSAKTYTVDVDVPITPTASPPIRRSRA